MSKQWNSVFPRSAAVTCKDKALVCLLTCNDSGSDVKLGDGAGERAGRHPNPAEDSAQHDGDPAAHFVHQHAAEGTWGSDVMLLVSGMPEEKWAQD